MKNMMITLVAACLLMPAYAQKLVILHTNDTHSQIEPLKTGDDKGFGGVERRLQYINSEREKYGNDKILLLDAGDYSQGTPYFTVAKGDLESELMNILRYDVATIGNHEFDNGQEELARRLKFSTFKTVCCNYDFTGTPLQGLSEPYVIIKRGGLKVGIIGATTRLDNLVFPANIKGMTLLNTIEEVNRYAAFLRNDKKCDLVILLSHLGYDGGSLKYPSDIIVAQNSEDIDIIIGGHTHTFMKNSDEIRNKNGKRVIVVQAGAKGIQVGELKIY